MNYNYPYKVFIFGPSGEMHTLIIIAPLGTSRAELERLAEEEWRNRGWVVENFHFRADKEDQ